MAKDKRASIYFDHTERRFVGLDDEIKDQLRTIYKNIDIDTELNKMSLWLASDRGAKRKGNITFIMNWLSKASPINVPNLQSDVHLVESDSLLAPILKEYLNDLWKNREHILELNTTKKKR